MTLPIPYFQQEDNETLANLGKSLKQVMLKSKAIAALFCGKHVPRKPIETSLDRDTLVTLKRLGIVETMDDAWVSKFCARVIEDKILFSDLPTGKAQREEFFLDPLWEAPTFACLLARSEGGTALDIGCGCGVLSIVMSDYCSSVVGVDINPRAIQMSKFNALLNGAENVTFLISDLFKSVSDQSFDRIVFNSPTGFELKPRNLLEADEQILKRFYRELPHHLKDGGFAQVNLCVKDYQGSLFWDRYVDWLGDGHEEFQTLFFELFRLSKDWHSIKKPEFLAWIGKCIQSIAEGTNPFTVIAVTRGILTTNRKKGNSYIISTNYHQWATKLGSKFGNTLFHWLVANHLDESEQERFEEQLIQSQPVELQALAQSVFYQCKQRIKLEFSLNQDCMAKNF
ncbi:MAG: methyltransferase [Kovacikia sp.]